MVQRWIVRQAWSASTRHWATTGLVALVVAGVVWVTGILSTQSHFAPLGIGCRLKLLFFPGDRWLSLPRVDEEREGCTAGVTDDWSDPTAPDSDREWAADPRLWVAHSILHRVRRIHLATGLAVIAVMIGRAASNALLARSGTAVLVVAVILLAITSAAPERPCARITTSWLTIPGVLAAAGSIAAPWVSSPFPEWSGIHDVNLMISVLAEERLPRRVADPDSG